MNNVCFDFFKITFSCLLKNSINSVQVFKREAFYLIILFELRHYFKVAF